MFKLKSVIGRVGLLAASALLLGTTLSCGQAVEAATGATYYVSPSGDNAGGASWQHAFSDMDKIQWGLIHSGDQVVIDGGQGNWNSPVNYYHSIVVPTGTPNVTISLSTDMFHNGAARIYSPAGNTTQPGINILSSNTTNIDGKTAYGLQLANFPVGVKVQGGYVGLNFLQIMGASGPTAQAGSPNRSSGILTSGRSSVLVNRTAVFNYNYSAVCSGGSRLSVMNSWLYNYSWAGVQSVSGGVFNHNGASNVEVLNCVLGPGLNVGVANYPVPGLATETASPLAQLSAQNCLLIQPGLTGVIELGQGPMICTNITEFKTPKNPYGQVGFAMGTFSQSATSLQVRASIVCGGIVSVPAYAQPQTTNNTQFNTSGNTRFLSNTQSNPQFLTVSPSMANPTNILQWINMDFSSQCHNNTLQGTTINSINALLNSWYYSAVSIG